MHKSYALPALLLVAAASLSACGPHDEAYFLSHPEALDQKMKECEKLNLEQLQTDKECKSAILAAQEAAAKKLLGDFNKRAQ